MKACPKNLLESIKKARVKRACDLNLDYFWLRMSSNANVAGTTCASKETVFDF